MPQFTYQDGTKIEFPLLVKKTQRRTDRDDWHEDENTSSSSGENMFSPNVTVKAASPAQDIQGEAKTEDGRWPNFIHAFVVLILARST